MRRLYAILIPLLLFTILLGSWISFNEGARSATASFRWLLFEILWQLWSRLLQFPRIASDTLVYLWYGSDQARDLWIFAGIALFGSLMVGLVIRTATKSPHDQTDALLKALIEEKEKAQNLARLKSEFLNQVSHELRTPLAVIIGYLECIIDGLYGQIENKHKEVLKVVSKQSNDLKNMIDHILIFSRLETGKQTLRIEEVRLRKMIYHLKETFDFLGHQKGLAVNWDIPRKLPVLQSDPEKLREILNNLLQNAVKYTDRGTISVRIGYLSSTDSISLEIADTGMGIPSTHLSTIFDPFIQVHKTSTENSRGGIGLGLSIVKKNVEQLKGTIQVESEFGKGSTFRIVIPRVYQEKQSRHKKLFDLKRLLRRTGLESATKPNGVSGTDTSTDNTWRFTKSTDVTRPHLNV